MRKNMSRQGEARPRRRSGDRDGRPIPGWERAVLNLVKALGAATTVLAIITVSLVLYVKFRDPSSAGAIVGPGVGTLVLSLFWGASWAALAIMRDSDHKFQERIHGRSPSA